VIKVAGFLKRAPGVTHDQLVEHWEKTHAPRVARYARPERYTVTFFDGGGDGFDGMASLYMRDQEHFRQAFSPEQVAETNQDGFTDLIDVTAALSLFTEEHVFLDEGPGLWRLVFLGKRLPDASRDEYQQTWLTDHAPMVAAALKGTVQRYAISVTTGPEGALYDGVAELGFESAEARERMMAGIGSAEPDAFARMTDQAGSLFLTGRVVTYV
jgi:hypothetical protein